MTDRTPDRLLTYAEVTARLTISRRSLERLVAAGRIRVVHPSPGRNAVTERELRAYLAYIEDRRGAA